MLWRLDLVFSPHCKHRRDATAVAYVHVALSARPRLTEIEVHARLPGADKARRYQADPIQNPGASG